MTELDLELDIDLFAIDLDKAKEGVWKRYDRDTRLEVCIRSLEYEGYDDRIQELRKEHLKGERTDVKIPNSVAADIVRRAIAETLVVDWRGLNTKAGEPIPYTPEMAYKIFCNPKFADLYDWCAKTASQLENYADSKEAVVQGK